jgi:hypothetical protein
VRCAACSSFQVPPSTPAFDRIEQFLRSGKSGKFVRINNPVKFEFQALRFEVLSDPRD